MPGELMTRATVLLCGVLALAFALPGVAADGLLLFSRTEAQAIKRRIANKDPQIAPLTARLREDAECRMKAGPWSVTFHHPKDTAAGEHDFFSEGPYWWPDPKNPDGPYIRRDGERNPNRFTANDDDMGAMSQAVFALGAAAWFFDEPRYAERAAKVLAVWFVDPATRMNPNLEYGQAIRNVTSGRGIGIIDSVGLIWAVQGMAFLDDTGRWEAREREGVRRWFAQYLEWLTQSKKGLDEKENGNNHSTWWAAQAAAYAVFTGDRAKQQLVWDFYREYLVPHEIRPDGSCPAEEARTNSLGYSAMNLNGFSLLDRIAERQGVNLWRFRAPDGASLEAAVRYLAPFVAHPETWRKQQISPFQPGQAWFLAVAGLGLKSPEYVALWRSLPLDKGLWPLLLSMLVE